MNLYRLHLYTLFIFAMVALLGCSDERISEKDKGGLTSNQIRLIVQIPSTAVPKNAMLKSGQTAAELRVNEIQVLVFENGLYAYKSDGANIDQSANTATFVARVRSTAVPTTLFIIANASSEVNASEPVIGAPINEVRTLFNMPYTTSSITSNFPMWGSYTFPSGISNTPLDITTPISLLRTFARVDVSIAPTASNFSLETVQVFRAASNMQLIPNSPNTELSVTSPSIPAGTVFNINTTAVNATSPTLSQAQVYLPESAAPTLANQVSQATCVVVGGRYNNSATRRFYRLDFNPQLPNHPLGQILRNNRYEFDISEVSADGYNTALEAANNPSSNMNFELVIWPGDQINYMYFDNFDYFGLSDMDIGLGGTVNYTKQIDIATNLSGYALRFGTDGAWQQTLDNGVFRVTRTNGDQTLVVTALTNNFTSNYRKQTMQIQAGNLNPITVQLIQTPSPPNIEWATTNVAAFRVFSARIQDHGNLYQWNRTTSFPANTTTAVGWSNTLDPSLVWVAANDPCPIGWRMATIEDWHLFVIMYPGISSRADGVFYAPTQAEANNATYANPGNAIFLPNTGFRSGTSGVFTSTNGGYIASDRQLPDGRFNVFLPAGGSNTIQTVAASTLARVVRCVRDL